MKHNLKVGQTVYFRATRYSDASSATITKIGRQYFYALKDKHSNERKIAIEEMREYIPNYGWGASVYLSQNAILEEDEANKLLSLIRKQFDHYYRPEIAELNLDQLRKIWQIIKGGDKKHDTTEK